MKKLIIVLMLIAVCLNAQDYNVDVVAGAVVGAVAGVRRPFVKLNIKYKGKIYKNYECQIVSYENNKAVIITKKGDRIMVEISKSSHKTALNAMAENEKILKKNKDYPEIRNLKNGTYLLITHLQMMQNLGELGCLVDYHYYIIEEWVIQGNPNNKPNYRLAHKKGKTSIYIIESFEVADEKYINLKDLDKNKSNKKYSEYVLYNIGLFRYTTAIGASRTVDKYTTKYSVYETYMKAKLKKQKK